MKISSLSVLILIIFSNTVFSKPGDLDYILGYGGIALVATNEFFKEKLAPVKPAWKEPNPFDLYFRDHLKSSDSGVYTANTFSDIVLWGMIIPCTFAAPAMSGYRYNEHLLVNMQVFAVTGIIVSTSKYIFARQRPYAFFNTGSGSEKYKDNLSFFSGHSAFAFATATTTSMLLQKKFHNISGLIWSNSLTLAATTGLLRIAADRHYMSDVLTGAVIGTLTAYLIAKNQKGRILEKKNPQKTILFNWSFPL